MALRPGARLGPYEVTALLGAGGMGEVYKARDTRLDRTVAIKILPDALAADPQFRERFDREARTISQLDHPHICALYDVGEHAGTAYLVMQYLDGITLSERLAKRPLPIREALTIAIQIAEALDKAHHAGIVHRDLKPGNVMLMKSGPGATNAKDAKLLDFGLAKAGGSGAVALAATVMPTTPANLTVQGTILGTFQYMAPEQIEGEEADARTDIFAFGALLFEMLTGKKAFEGKTQATLIGAIMHSDPRSLVALQPMTPVALDHVVNKCLAKDPNDRWQTARDIAGELKWIAEAGSQVSTAVVSGGRRSRTERQAWAVAAILLLFLLAAGVLAVLYVREPPARRDAVRFLLATPPKMSFRPADVPVISPDGRFLAFTGLVAGGTDMLWVRPLDSLTPRSLPGTEGARFPFWSPDSGRLGFFAGGKLKKVDVSGGSPQALCDAIEQVGAGGTWSRDGVILFAGGLNTPLHSVSAAGGKPRVVTTLDTSRSETSHRWPMFLPDGRHFLYLALDQPPLPNPRVTLTIRAGSLMSRDTTAILNADSGVRYASGRLLYMQDTTLMSQAFNVKTVQLSGEPRHVADLVATDATYTGVPAFSVSDNDVLSYKSNGFSTDLTHLVWVDRTGREMEVISEPGVYTNPALSPDGGRVAVGRLNPETGKRDIWLFDGKRTTGSRFTFDPADDTNPAWSPDGNRIVFTSDRGGQRDLFQKAATGTGVEQLLFSSAQSKSVIEVSADGRFVLYATPAALWLFPLVGAPPPKPFVFETTRFDARGARFSPNGRWVAYQSNESSRPEIYVQSFPETSGKWPVSLSGGIEAHWRRDGKELFYIADGKIMAVPVKTDASVFEYGTPTALFATRLPAVVGRNRYVAAADGQRFLLNVLIDEGTSPLNIVLNWTAELKN